LDNPIYQYDDFEDEYGDEEMAYVRHRRFANPNPNMRGRFPDANWGARFSYPNHDREGGNPNSHEYRMKVEILFIVGTLILNPSWIRFMK